VTLVVHALVLINIDSNMHGDEIKSKATVMSCYHVIITLTQSRAPSVNTQLQSCHVNI